MPPPHKFLYQTRPALTKYSLFCSKVDIILKLITLYTFFSGNAIIVCNYLWEPPPFPCFFRPAGGSCFLHRKILHKSKKRPRLKSRGLFIIQCEYNQESMPRLVRYFLTIRATLNVMASSNSRRSSPVSFLIFSSR